ncbi:uncharacterized protein K460DRAFT_374823 [Cucurbitaria berberidis CBS 394.84]|uniref:CCHC-type domain-containing protein n=1 Tax=Cucurbitaria berberidis CBS 394.84 TaxID=1168544 RepID=A0A9P4GLW0_9PLEO|nr:uncharacterized protein K460DRAFT_374823 [Cucurbitaria berberidis CBS 394.84]KAF1847844.1 hypothetical protein K460DRAFT_374823 [Cucurbitaria berberidis CBS 394.84]
MADSTPKSMSSRLMTMKFMQRSAAKSVASAPSTPNGPPSKKKRLANGASAPSTPDQEILQSALVAEEKKRQEALEKAAQYTGETKWVLSFKDPLDGKRKESMKVRQAGFAEIDAGDDSDEEEEEPKPIRMQFGGGVKKADKPITFEKAEDSEGEIESTSEEYDSDDPTAALIRETKREVAAERRESRKAHTSTGNDSPRGPPRPPHEDMNLGGLTSISGGRRPGARDMGNVECYRCGQKGHMKDDCPKPNTPRGSAGRGRGRGRR